MSHVCITHEWVGEVACPRCREHEAHKEYREAAPRSPIFEAIKLDLDSRNRKGFLATGKVFEPSQGKEWIREAYEEALDLCAYLKGLLMKEDKCS